MVIILIFSLLFCGTNFSFADNNSEEGDDVVYAKLVGLLDIDGAIQEIELPLKHTDVKAEVSGYVAKVDVEQEYENTFKEAIEAIYVFPLPTDAAIYSMEMIIGERIIKGEIKEREEARQIYEQAKHDGKRTSLLDQERPNVFTQSVANIMPGDKIIIRISYVETLPYDAGEYSFMFPMVVGPRYVPLESSETLLDIDRDSYDDATEIDDAYHPAEEKGEMVDSSYEISNRRTARKIDAPILLPGIRSGHDISLSVHIDTGNIAIKNLDSTTHKIEKDTLSDTEAIVKILASDSIPNKDFVLTYAVAGALPEFSVLTEKKENDDGFFTMMIQPPLDLAENEVLPKEIIFIVDVSGSMRGTSINIVKEAMTYSLKNLNELDTFNIYLFANNFLAMSPEPIVATDDNLEKGLDYIAGIQAGGGTQMMPAIEKAVEDNLAEGRLRIVSMMSDGQIYNDDQIIETIQASKSDQIRFFPFSIGAAPNRYLLERMAEVGAGKSFYVGNNDNSKDVIDEFYARIDAPVFVNLEIDWDGLKVYDVYPKVFPDLFAGEPVYVTGRYKNDGDFDIELSGFMSSLEGSSEELIKKLEKNAEAKIPVKEEKLELSVNFPDENTGEFGISSIWARNKVKDLMNEERVSNNQEAVKEEIIAVGIKYHLMTNYTSFVAVEDEIVNSGGQMDPANIAVPLPQGTSYSGYNGGVQNEMLSDTSAYSGGHGPNVGISYAGNFALEGGGYAMKDDKNIFIKLAIALGFVLGTFFIILGGFLLIIYRRTHKLIKAPRVIMIIGGVFLLFSVFMFFVGEYLF